MYVRGSNLFETDPKCRRTILGVFFFQAEDGIRDYKVTGVQTCALPICKRPGHRDPALGTRDRAARCPPVRRFGARAGKREIGRGSWRGRGEISVVAVSFKKKKKKLERRERLVKISGGRVRSQRIVARHL